MLNCHLLLKAQPHREEKVKFNHLTEINVKSEMDKSTSNF